MNPLAAAALAAGELICEFNDGHRKSLLAKLTGDSPRTEMVLVYESLKPDSAEVLSTRRPGRRAVQVRASGGQVLVLGQPGMCVQPSQPVTPIGPPAPPAAAPSALPPCGGQVLVPGQPIACVQPSQPV